MRLELLISASKVNLGYPIPVVEVFSLQKDFKLFCILVKLKPVFYALSVFTSVQIPFGATLYELLTYLINITLLDRFCSCLFIRDVISKG